MHYHLRSNIMHQAGALYDSPKYRSMYADEAWVRMLPSFLRLRANIRTLHFRRWTTAFSIQPTLTMHARR